MTYYPAFICENGHEISTLSNSCSDKYCSKCGSRIINRCPHCNGVIRGRPDESYGFITEFEVPTYCRSCGKPYPWTSAAIEATVHLLEASDLTSVEQQDIVQILPDAISETPRTLLAAVRFKKALASAGSFVAEGLRQFAIDFGCELLKKQLDL